MALVCCECGRESDAAAKHWRAYHVLEQLSDDETVMTFCPDCAERQFGSRPPTSRHDDEETAS